jgi:hypothetical protein
MWSWGSSTPPPKINWTNLGPSIYANNKLGSNRNNSSYSLPNKYRDSLSSRNSSSSSIDSSTFGTPQEIHVFRINNKIKDLDSTFKSITTCEKWTKKDCKRKIIKYINQLSDYVELCKNHDIPILDRYNYLNSLETIMDIIKEKQITNSNEFTHFIGKQSIKHPKLAEEIHSELTEEEIPLIEREIQENYAHLLEDLKKHNPKLENLNLNEIIKLMGSTTYGGNKKYPLIRSKRFQHPARGKVFSRSNTKKKIRKYRRKTVRSQCRR